MGLKQDTYCVTVPLPSWATGSRHSRPTTPGAITQLVSYLSSSKKDVLFSTNSHLTRWAVDGIGVTLWSGLELDVALICACMPSVYPLFLRMIHRGRQQPVQKPVPQSSLVTIGGSGGKLMGRFKKRGLWSVPSGLDETNVHVEDASTKWSNSQYVELTERSTN